jgi:hypothetical protein
MEDYGADAGADVRGEVVEEAVDAALDVADAIVVVDLLDVLVEQISLKRLVVSIFGQSRLIPVGDVIACPYLGRQ